MPPEELAAIGAVIAEEVARQRALPPLPTVHHASPGGHAPHAAIEDGPLGG
jgi:hypothetical protein